MMNKRSNRPWADLPQELLLTIANFLTSNPIDILTFRAICKSWNFASPPFSPFNLSPMLPLICSRNPLHKYDIYFSPSIPGRPIISVTAIFALGQKRLSNMQQDTKCWLMFVDQLTPGKLMIRQPFTKYHYSIPLNFPSGLDVPNIHVDEIARFYNFSFHPEMNKPPSMWSEYVQKVVVNSDESRVFAILYNGIVGTAKLTMDIQLSTSGWCSLSLFGVNVVLINDIVYHKSKLLGVDHVGKVYVWDCLSPTEKVFVSPITSNCTKRKRLVESNGFIYLVVREETNGGLRFKVFELDEDLDECVEVSSVGDMVFFFGLDFSFSVSSQKLGGSFRKNCIVFIENSFKDYDGQVDDDVMLFSNLSFGDLRVGVWHLEDPYHCRTIGSYPGYSNVLWPPPPWFWSIDMSKRIGQLEVALDDLLMYAPAENLKAMSTEQPSLEQGVVVGDDANEQDISEIWRATHTMQAYLNEAKEIHKQLESIKSENAVSKQQPCYSLNIQDQAESSSRGTEVSQGSVNAEASDAVIFREMKLNGILLHLEENTAKLLKIRPKNIQRRSTRVRKSTRDEAFTYE